jgi:hypothetical protein
MNGIISIPPRPTTNVNAACTRAGVARQLKPRHGLHGFSRIDILRFLQNIQIERSAEHCSAQNVGKPRGAMLRAPQADGFCRGFVLSVFIRVHLWLIFFE